jgi:hypothetical protein
MCSVCVRSIPIPALALALALTLSGRLTHPFFLTPRSTHTHTVCPCACLQFADDETYMNMEAADGGRVKVLLPPVRSRSLSCFCIRVLHFFFLWLC